MFGSSRAGRAGAVACIAWSAALLLVACSSGTKTAKPAETAVSAQLVSEVRIGETFAIATQGTSTVGTVDISIPPGQNNRWHSHPGPVMVAVKKGTATLYYGDDPTCTPHQVVAGTGFFEPKGRVHIVRNETNKPLELVANYVVPVGMSAGELQGKPVACPF